MALVLRRPLAALAEPLPLYGRMHEAGLFDWSAGGSLLQTPSPLLGAAVAAATLPSARPMYYDSALGGSLFAMGGGMYAAMPDVGGVGGAGRAGAAYVPRMGDFYFGAGAGAAGSGGRGDRW